MKDIEKMFSNTDFSKHTDLKERLAKQLFQPTPSDKVVSLPFQSLSDDDLDFVNAAQGIWRDDEDPNLLK